MGLRNRTDKKSPLDNSKGLFVQQKKHRIGATFSSRIRTKPYFNFAALFRMVSLPHCNDFG